MIIFDLHYSLALLLKVMLNFAVVCSIFSGMHQFQYSSVPWLCWLVLWWALSEQLTIYKTFWCLDVLEHVHLYSQVKARWGIVTTASFPWASYSIQESAQEDYEIRVWISCKKEGHVRCRCHPWMAVKSSNANARPEPHQVVGCLVVFFWAL